MVRIMVTVSSVECALNDKQSICVAPPALLCSALLCSALLCSAAVYLSLLHKYVGADLRKALSFVIERNSKD